MGYKQITIDEYREEDEATLDGDPGKDCTDRACEWGICSQANT